MVVEIRGEGSLSIDELKSLYLEAQLRLHSATLRMSEMQAHIDELSAPSADILPMTAEVH